MKKLFSIPLCLMILLSLLCFPAAAEDVESPTVPDQIAANKERSKDLHEAFMKASNREHPVEVIYADDIVTTVLVSHESTWTYEDKAYDGMKTASMDFSGRLPNGAEYTGTVSGKYAAGEAEITGLTCAFQGTPSEALGSEHHRDGNTVTVTFTQDGEPIQVRTFKIATDGTITEI